MGGKPGGKIAVVRFLSMTSRQLLNSWPPGKYLCSFNRSLCWGLALVAFIAASSPAAKSSPAALAHSHQKSSDAPEGFAIDLKASEADVLKAVELVTQDTILHGTQVYAREDELTEAEAATGSAYYGPWTGPGHAFYKVREKALSPQHFKNSTDIGTITVRYIVLGVAPNRTHLQIDAVFIEDGSKRVHASDTTVETSEFAEIQSHIVRIQREERQTADALQRRQLQLAAQSDVKERNAEAAQLKDAESSVQSLELRLHELQRQAELRVKVQADLKSAPFLHAATLQSVPANSDVLLEIITPYWYGVETVDGRRGWLRHDQVEPIP
jgi:Skp family chaperone for outer membrane proteins